ARENRRVLLLDAAKIGSEASSAAAGMLAPRGEFDEPAMFAFAARSFAQYPDFVRSIEADSGLSVEFRPTTAVEIALTTADLSKRPGATVLDRDQLRALAPLTRPDAIGGLHFQDEAIVDPAALMRALRAACLARGVCLKEGSPVASVAVTDHGAQVSDFSARVAVVAAGAWSSGITATIDGRLYPLPRAFPVKGHLLGYRLSAGSLPITIRHGHTYVLQRADGFTIAGSSAEDAGFDRAIDPQIVADIAARAGALVPALRDLQPESVWAGFRPGTNAPAPHIGRVQTSRLWIAYGHYRNGILLAPATSEQICREIEAALE
ncbi:MAG TPA: FAD-dependent oxidoreductase, partial [Bryobacteraceae bacterium]|nr:FAD-dependent oxidoreductase [Bryobacteraceae bacterium]